MRGVVIIASCFAMGCGFDIPLGNNGNGGNDGGSGSNDDGGMITGDGSLGCYGSGLVIVCPLAQPPTSYDITVPTTLDTNVSGNCTMVNGTNVTGTCVVVAENITISHDLRGIGPRPLVLVATKTLRVSGSIDVASHRDSQGAGVSTSVCAGAQGPGGVGGGAGGSFGGQGGVGGNGDGGSAGPTTTPTSLRAGCRGQGGAGPFGIGGTGSFGGGAVALIAGTMIEISGRVNASGEGGDGGELGAVAGGGGGGGGGSGGMILIDAPAVAIMGHVFANGGGGGGGSSGVSNAGNGQDPPDAQTMPGGGTNAGGAGKGGRGTQGSTLDGGPGENQGSFGNGGGGGGGGAGYIKIYGTPTISGHVSPPQS
ncbi:MAG: hypothetical protein AB7T06_21520 [Kofleriaceae bacterium]